MWVENFDPDVIGRGRMIGVEGKALFYRLVQGHEGFIEYTRSGSHIRSTIITYICPHKSMQVMTLDGDATLWGQMCMVIEIYCKK